MLVRQLGVLFCLSCSRRFDVVDERRQPLSSTVVTGSNSLGAFMISRSASRIWMSSIEVLSLLTSILQDCEMTGVGVGRPALAVALEAVNPGQIGSAPDR